MGRTFRSSGPTPVGVAILEKREISDTQKEAVLGGNLAKLLKL